MPGLPTRTLDLLADLDGPDQPQLGAEEGRRRRVEDWLTPARELVDELRPAVAELDPDLVLDARVDRSILRLHRDRRFHPDHWKPHLDIWAWHGDNRNAAPSGLYLRVRHDRVEVSAGVRLLQGERLRRYRALVTGDLGDTLVDAVATARAGGSGLPPPDLVATPRAHQTDEVARSELLRRRSCLVVTGSTPPASIATARFVPWIIRRWQAQRAVHHWIVTHLPVTA